MRKSALIAQLRAELNTTRVALTELRILTAELVHTHEVDLREARDEAYNADRWNQTLADQLEVYDITAAYAAMVYGVDVAALKTEALLAAESDRYGYDGHYEVPTQDDHTWSMHDPAELSWSIPNEVAVKWDDAPF